MALYGISGSHTTEACPLNNDKTAKMVLHAESIKIEQIAKNTKLTKLWGNITRH